MITQCPYCDQYTEVSNRYLIECEHCRENFMKTEFQKSIDKLINTINTKTKKAETCDELAEMFYNKKDKIPTEFTDQTIQGILGKYKIEFIKYWCKYCVNDGGVNQAISLAKMLVTKQSFPNKYIYYKGIVLLEIASMLNEKHYNESFNSIIGDVLICAKKCYRHIHNYNLVNGVLLLFREYNIQDTQIISVIRQFTNPYYKDWSIFAILTYGYAVNNYDLRFKILLEYDDFNSRVISQELNLLFNDINNDIELNKESKIELIKDFSLLTYESTLSDKTKKQIMHKSKRMLN